MIFARNQILSQNKNSFRS